MAFEDWNFGGIKTRVGFRVQNLPMYTDPLRGIAVNKGIRELYLFARVNTTILDTVAFALPDGSAASEYPLVANTLWVSGVNLDGFPVDGPMSEEEVQNTGMEQASSVMTTGSRSWMVRTEEDGSKTLVLWPRPNVGQPLRVFGGVAPNYLVAPLEVPVIGEVYGDAIEYYAVQYLLIGQEGTEEKQALFFQQYLKARAEAKLGLRLDRRFKTRRSRVM